MKTMDIDAEHLGIPDTTYSAVVKFSSTEYARIVRDLSIIGESVKISVAKDTVLFEANGEIGTAKLQLKQGAGGASTSTSSSSKAKKEVKGEDSDDEEEEGEDEDEEEEDVKPKSKKRKTTVKEEGDGKKKRTTKKKDEDDAPVHVNIEMQQATSMSFALKYLTHFAKAGPLCPAVALSMTDDLPLMVSSPGVFELQTQQLSGCVRPGSSTDSFSGLFVVSNADRSATNSKEDISVSS